MAPLRGVDLARTFARSLCLQASWSFEGLQSLGFAYAMDPVLVRVHAGEALREARTRHLEFFNTHPFLAAAVLGCAARLEEQGGPDVDATVRRVKRAMMGPYGAVGDTFFWGALKPFLVVLALHAALRGHAWAPWAFVAPWATANLVGRLYFFLAGYRGGMDVVRAVERLRLLEAARLMKGATALLLGALLAYAAGPERFGLTGAPALAWTAAVGLVTFVLAWIGERGLSPLWFAYLFAAVAAWIGTWT